jgi:hypothetical protein
MGLELAAEVGFKLVRRNARFDQGNEQDEIELFHVEI